MYHKVLYTWVYMHLDGSTCSESFPERTCHLNPQSTCHGSRPGTTLVCGVRAGSLVATERRARGKTCSRKRKKCRRAKKSHLYYTGICTRFPIGGKFYGVKNTATVQRNQPWCVYVHRKRAVLKGATQGTLGCAPPVRSRSTSVFF